MMEWRPLDWDDDRERAFQEEFASARAFTESKMNMTMAQPAMFPSMTGRSSDGTIDKIFERVGSPDLFLRVLIEAGYRLYRVEFKSTSFTGLVWAKPVVEVIEFERREIAWHGEGWYRRPIAWQEVPKIRSSPPDLDFMDIVGDPLPVRMRATSTTLDGALLVLDPDDSGTIRELQLYG